MPEQQGSESFLQDVEGLISERMVKLAGPLINQGEVNSYGLWLRASTEVREELRQCADLALVDPFEPDSSNLPPPTVNDALEAMQRDVREGYGNQDLDPETRALLDAMPTISDYVHRRNAAFRPHDPEAPQGGSQ